MGRDFRNRKAYMFKGMMDQRSFPLINWYRLEGGEVMQEWSNQSVLGYVIMAAERIGMSEADIQRLVSSTHNRFDMKTLEEAAEHYRKSPY